MDYVKSLDDAVPQKAAMVERQEQLRKELKALQDHALQLFRDGHIKCGCGANPPHKTLTLYREHYYVPPRGCMEGDYWRFNFSYVRTPCCKEKRQILAPFDGAYEIFAGTEDTYPG